MTSLRERMVFSWQESERAPARWWVQSWERRRSSSRPRRSERREPELLVCVVVAAQQGGCT